MVIGEFLIGAGCYTLLITSYIIASEFCEEKMKQYVIVGLNAIWGFVEMLIAALYFWLPQWQYYVFAFVTAPNILLLIFGFFFLVESPYYLIEKRQDLELTM